MEMPDWQCTASHCSFCGRFKDVIEWLIVGPNAIGICEHCVSTCVDLLKEKEKQGRLAHSEEQCLDKA